MFLQIRSATPLPRLQVTGCHLSNDCLAALVHMDVLDRHPLVPGFTFQLGHNFELFVKQTHEAHGPMHARILAFKRLLIKGCSSQEHQRSVMDAKHLNRK